MKTLFRTKRKIINQTRMSY